MCVCLLAQLNSINYGSVVGMSNFQWNNNYTIMNSALHVYFTGTSICLLITLQSSKLTPHFIIDRVGIQKHATNENLATTRNN